jgi:hypothetical protein
LSFYIKAIGMARLSERPIDKDIVLKAIIPATSAALEDLTGDAVLFFKCKVSVFDIDGAWRHRVAEARKIVLNHISDWLYDYSGVDKGARILLIKISILKLESVASLRLASVIEERAASRAATATRKYLVPSTMHCIALSLVQEG